MRGHLPAFDLRAAPDLAAVLRLLADEPGAWHPFAGGTDLMVLFEAGKLAPGKYISLWNLAELRGITVTPQALTLGALTTYADVQAHPVLQSEFPLLCKAAEGTGGIATQNRGTLGGNIANGSPAADTPPALLVYDAALDLISVRGARRVPYDRFHSAYKVMDLREDEIIGSITLPRQERSPGGWTEMYRKVGTRKAQAISKVCVAAAAALEDGVVRDVRIACGSVGPVVIRCRTAEAALRGRVPDEALASAAAAALEEDITPVDDIRSTARYRLHVARNLLIQFVKERLIRRTH
jgi:CO/xanthine dehydrogenase FAD-binding subunit